MGNTARSIKPSKRAGVSTKASSNQKSNYSTNQPTQSFRSRLETFNSEIHDLRVMTQAETFRNNSMEKENREVNYQFNSQLQELKKVVLEVRDLMASELDMIKIQTSRD